MSPNDIVSCVHFARQYMIIASVRIRCSLGHL